MSFVQRCSVSIPLYTYNSTQYEELIISDIKENAVSKAFHSRAQLKIVKHVSCLTIVSEIIEMCNICTPYCIFYYK